jgi:hypothetical protein
MPINFDKVNPSTTPELIATFEKAWDIVLPDEYKEFLLQTNGGIATWFNFIRHLHSYRTKTGECKQVDTYATLEEVYGANSPSGDLYTLDLETKNTHLKAGDGEGTYLLPDTIAIASAMGGHNFFGIVVGKSKFGQVYLWSYGLPDYEYAVKLADSFTEFLEKITDETEEIDLS